MVYFTTFDPIRKPFNMYNCGPHKSILLYLRSQFYQFTIDFYSNFVLCLIHFRFINARRRIVQPMIDQSNRAGKYTLKCLFDFSSETSKKKRLNLKQNVATRQENIIMEAFQIENSKDTTSSS